MVGLRSFECCNGSSEYGASCSYESPYLSSKVPFKLNSSCFRTKTTNMRSALARFADVARDNGYGV